MPKTAWAVSCSERCKRGLPRASISSGVSKFGGSSPTTLGGSASAAKRSLQRYHQAMSCGLTNDTVVHHGSSLGAVGEPVFELRDDVRVDPPTLPGRAVGRGVGAAGEAVGLERPESS